MNRPSTWHSGWPETVCGKGAKLSETLAIRTWLPVLYDAYNVVTVADVGCGDRNWMRHTEFNPGVHILSYDFKPLAGDVHKFDCTKDVLPMKFDLIQCVYVLNHLYEEGAAQKAVLNFKHSGATWLLATYNDVDPFPLTPIETMWHKEKISGYITRQWSYGLFKL